MVVDVGSSDHRQDPTGGVRTQRRVLTPRFAPPRCPDPTSEGAPLHVLFVCTGNICRSPMAERLAAATSAELGLTDFTTSSAGTRAVIGHAIHKHAARIISERGGDVSGFAARQLNSRIASGADLVLAMTKAHRDAVLEAAPHKLNRTFTLTEAARIVSLHNPQAVSEMAALRSHVPAADAPDIADPIGQSEEFFAEVGSQIAALLPPILELCRS